MIRRHVVTAMVLLCALFFGAGIASAQDEESTPESGGECVLCDWGTGCNGNNQQGAGPSGEWAHREGGSVWPWGSGYRITHDDCRYFEGAATTGMSCHVSSSKKHTNCACEPSGCEDVAGEEPLPLVTSVLADSEAITKLLRANPRSLRLNAERSALQIMNCGGGVRYHVPVDPEQTKAVIAAIAQEQRTEALWASLAFGASLLLSLPVALKRL